MKIKKILAKILVCLIMIFSLGSCIAEKEVCGTYNLISMTGVPGFSEDSYVYNRIILERNYEFTIENKDIYYGIKTKQTGKWDLNKEKDEITFVIKQGSRETEEVYEYRYDEKQIVMSTMLEGYHITMVFQLED